ncbi:hypothetical protein QN277_026845 [Acacia crassicarpa]|uniref:Uncharacterized protein n=1 Tax=Acacia crassicarpa TaxID=499986 RepID=A0AAE1K523_9FABA|nr:hypothetical protein QN277_026845 [Acacia crassicarpa]
MEVDNYYGGMWAIEKSGIDGRQRVGRAPSWRGYIESTSSPLSKAEAKRKKRVAKYKSYERERKVKSAIKRGFLWLKRKIEKITHAF